MHHLGPLVDAMLAVGAALLVDPDDADRAQRPALAGCCYDDLSARRLRARGLERARDSRGRRRPRQTLELVPLCRWMTAGHAGADTILS
jgi:hypothetical protein